MSTNSAQNWLISHNKSENSSKIRKKQSKAKVITVTSGKGGVGKTSVALKLAKDLSKKGKVLLLDCDYNLSNTSLKLGLPVNNYFSDFLDGSRSFSECLHTNGNFHLFSACNGSMSLFDKGVDLEQVIVQILFENEKKYDFIILDCAAGIQKEMLTLCSYSDCRLIVMTPDKSSVTDSYSLIKLLNLRYGTKKFHILFNKISSEKQFKKLVKGISSTVDQFLECQVSFIGSVPLIEGPTDRFDDELLGGANTALSKSFNNIVSVLADEMNRLTSLSKKTGPLFVQQRRNEHEVQPNLG